VALMAARRGWDLALNYARDAAAAERTAAEVRAEGAQALLLPADVADDAAVVAMFAALDVAWGGLDGLVNNAGIVDVAQRVDEYSAARVQRMFAVNVFGSFSCAREAVRRMSTRHGGRGGAIVNIGSVASKLGSAGQYVDYAAAKGAIDVFTVGLSREVAAEGVRVNAVRPGITDTEIHASGGQPDRARALAPQIPMQRPGAADEIAEAVLWLLSDAAGYTTGALLDVTGGR
jgi:NAD(P)-dependent dehydrogenase (short-subunit alcohol dehydrogenase family)